MNRLIINSFAGIIQKVLTSILVFISVPIFIYNLGIDNYGLFTVVSLIGNLNLFANFGLSTSLLVFLSKQEKNDVSNCDICSSLIMVFLFCLIFSFLIWMFRHFILIQLLNVSEKDFLSAVVLLKWLLFANTFLFLGQSFVAVLDSMQKIDISNLCQFVYNLLYWVGLIAVVYLGGSFNGIGAVIFMAAFIWLLLIYYFVHRYWGNFLAFYSMKLIKKSISKQLHYGVKVYLSGLFGFLFEPLSKMLLSNLISLQAVALFEIATKIRSTINDLVIKGLYPINPYIASHPDNDKLFKLITDLSRKIQLVVQQGGILIAFLIPITMKIWIHDDTLQHLDLFTIVLTLNLLLLSPPSLPVYLYLLNKNKAEKTAFVQLSSVVANLVVFLLTYRYVGIYAILFSNFFGYLSSFLLCKYYQYKYFHSHLKVDLIYYLRLLLIGCATTFISICIYYIIGNSYTDFLVFPVLIFILSIVLIRWLSLITRKDIELYFNSLPRFQALLSKLFCS